MTAQDQEATAVVDAAYYVRTGPSTYRPTLHVQGAWVGHEQHMGPVSGLIARAIEECSPRTDLQLARICYDILGPMPMEQVEITARVTRPGRTIELLEAEMLAAGRAVVRAHAWRLAVRDTREIAGGELPSMPAPDAAAPWDGRGVWPGGFIASLELRVLPGRRPGHGRVWIRPRVPLLAAEPTGVLATFMGAVDTMNGLAVRVPPEQVLFPNTDLTVHLVRAPVGEWLGIECDVEFGPTGVGVTAAALHDIEGCWGRALQILTIRPRT